METNERLEKEYQRVISKLFDKLSKRDDEIKDLKKMINKLDKDITILEKLIANLLKKESDK